MVYLLTLSVRALTFVLLAQALSEGYTPTLTPGVSLMTPTPTPGLSFTTPSVCPDGQQFCLTTGSCLSEESCAATGQYGGKCAPGFVYCLQAGKCIRIADETCDELITTITCPAGHVFCLETGTCVSANGDCRGSNDKYPSDQACQNDEVFCLQSASCVKRDGSPCIEISHCKDDEIFCLQSGQCVKKDKDCGGSIGKPGPDGHLCGYGQIFCLQRGHCVDKKEGCHDDSHHCGYGQIFCLQRGHCVDKKEGCHDDSHHCGYGQIFCLQRGHCVDKKEGCHDDSHHCGYGQIFCLQRGYCVDKNENCHDDSTVDSHHCGYGQIFCLQRGHCVDRKEGCHDDSHHCGYGQIFCLQRGHCVDKKEGCHDDSTVDSHHCGYGQVFCLQRGHCVDKKENCHDDSTVDSHHCGYGQIFCLQRGHCVDRKEGCHGDSHHCGYGQIFCLQRGHCVDKNENCHDDSHHCGYGQIFCLQRGHCVDKNENCHDNSHHCGYGQIFCLQRGHCVDKKEGCHDDSHHCGYGQIFCLQRGHCVDKKENCHDDSHHCGYGQIFCLQRGHCVDKNENCHDDSTVDSHHCGYGQIFCLQRGHCVDRKEGCHDDSYHCGYGQIFCLQRGHCVDKKEGCHDDSTVDSHHCGYGQVFCLQRGHCVDKKENCHDDSTVDSHHCGYGQIFCLQRGHCVDRKEGCHGDSHHCGYGQVFCLQRGHCVDKKENCHNDSTVDSHHCGYGQIFCLQRGHCVDRKEGCHGDSHHCGYGQVFCLQRGHCVDKKENCHDDSTVDSHHCGYGQIFCLQRGHCVDRKEGCHGDSHHCGYGQILCLQRGHCVDKKENCNDYSTADIQSCGYGQIFCLQRGHCVVKREGCHENSHHCGYGKIFCLQRGHCVDKRGGCHDDSHHCGYGQFFCLQRGHCVDKKENCHDDSTVDSHHCGYGQIFCLQRGHCVDKKENCHDYSTADIQSCGYDQIFCLKRGHCVGKKEGCHENSHHCGYGQVFCLQRGHCVDKREGCHDNNTADIQYCGYDQIFCLQGGHCVDKREGCYDNSTVDIQHCIHGQIFCLQIGHCVDRRESCHDNSTVDIQYCGYDQILCLQRGHCVDRRESCHDNSTADIQYCGYNQIFCLQRGHCADRRESCHDNSTADIQHCGDGQIFCIERGHCVDRIESCHDNSTADIQYCGYDQMFCLQRGHCVDRRESCHDNSTADIQYCGYGQIFCLQRGHCVDRRESCHDNSTADIQYCGYGQMFCLQRGHCVDRRESCHDNSTADIQYCGYGQIFCLQRGHCVDKGEGCHDNSTADIQHCNDGLIFCVERGHCVDRREICHDNSTVDIQYCGYDQIFCLQRGHCVDRRESCHDNSTADIQYCGYDQIFCLQRGHCVDKREGCHDNNTNESGHQCLKNEVFCLDGGRCVQPVCDSSTTITPPVTTDQRCTEQQLFCLSTAQCIEKSCSQTQYTTAPYSTTSTTTSPVFITDKVAILQEPVLYDEEVSFTLEDLGFPAIPTAQSLYIKCDPGSGLIFYKASVGMILGSTDSILVSDTLTVTSSGRSSGLVACEILGIPANIASGSKYHIAGLAIPKVLPKPTVTLATTSVAVMEGTEYWSASNLMFHVEQTDHTPVIDPGLEFLNSKDIALANYNSKWTELKSDAGLPYLSVTVPNVPLDSDGLPMMFLYQSHDGTWTKARPFTGIKIKSVLETDLFRIYLNKVYSGNIQIQIENGGLESSVIFTLEVLPMNNAPVVLYPDNTDGILENILVHPYTGDREFVIGTDIVRRIFKDDDNDPNLGLAVLGPLSDQLGTWQYDIGSGWQSLTVKQLPALEDSGIDVTAILLGPSHKLKFVPLTSSYLWSKREAWQYTKLYALAWDGTNDGEIPADRQTIVTLQKCSDQIICGPGGNTPYSMIVIDLVINRAGCDGVPGSMMTLDDCGECGGYNDCYDCSGKANGGAIIDDCLDCTGGNTGLTPNYRKDCRNQCGMNYQHPIFHCVPIGIDEATLRALFLQCDGQLESDAYTNMCDHCVLGNTTRAEDYGINACGTCDVSETCLDCSGMAYGPHDINACGQCLLKSDINFNSGCIKLGSAVPSLFGASGERPLLIAGAGLSSYTSARCSLINTQNSQVIQLHTTGFNRDLGEIQAVTDPLLPDNRGRYRVRCVFDDVISTELELTDQLIVIFCPELTSIQPEQLDSQQEHKVTITGTNFVDTGYIKCGVVCPIVQSSIQCFYDYLTEGGFLLFKASRIDETHVECDLGSKFKVAWSYTIFVLLEPPTASTLNSLSMLQFSVVVPAPQPQFTKFHYNFCSVKIKFDLPVEGPELCNEIFDDASYSKLGADSQCNFLGDGLTISFKEGQSTLRPGDQLTFKDGAVYRRNSKISFTTPVSGTVTVLAPDTLNPWKAKLSGPSSGTLGNCDISTLYLNVVGKGCMKLENAWIVRAAGSNPSAEVQQNLATIQGKYNALPTDTRHVTILSSEIIAGSIYTYTVSVTNNMDGTTKQTSINITRSVDVKPLGVKLIVIPNFPDPRRGIGLKALTEVSPCSGIDTQETSLMYAWHVNSTDAKILSFLDKPLAKIKAGSLRGGHTYSVAVTVFTADASDTATVTFTTKTQPLKVIIAKYIKTYASTDTILDASKSYDPDYMPERATFSWACAEESQPDMPCIVKQNGQNVMLETFVAPTDPYVARLTLPASSVPVGRYIWNVTMVKDRRSSSAQFVVEVIGKLTPQVDIDDLVLALNPGEPIRIKSKVSTFGQKPVTMYWSSVDEEGYDYVNLDKVTSDMVHLLRRELAALSFYDFSLYLSNGLPPGGKYKIQLTVEAGEEGLTGVKSVEISVNSAPSTGFVQILPLSGIAMETKFMFTIGDGWIDNEDDTVLFYIFVRQDGTSERQGWNARPYKEQLEHEVLLPEGVFQFFLEACDVWGACNVYQLPASVTVSERNMTNADVTTAVANVKKKLKTDIDSAFSMARSLSKEVGSSQELISLLNEVSYEMLSSTEASFDREEALRVLETVGQVLKQMLEALEALTSKTIEESQSKAYQLAALAVGSQSTAQRRRRKRAVPSDSDDTGTVQVNSLTTAEAQTIMDTYSVTFSGQELDTITSLSVEDYLVAMDSVRKGLCAGITNAEDPVVIETDLNTLRVKSMEVTSITATEFDVTCQNCSVNHTAKVTYGRDIETTYHHWNCTNTEECYGACFTSSQMSTDLITATSPDRYSINLNRRSDVVTLKLLNPSTYEIIPVGLLSTPIYITIPVQGDVNLTEYSLQCLKWSGTNWDEGGCMTQLPETSDDISVYTVNCTCNSLGVFSVFEGPPDVSTTTLVATSTDGMNITEEVTTTEEMTTATEVTTSPDSESTTGNTATQKPSVDVPPSASRIYTMFKLHDDYDSTVAGDVANFVLHMIRILASFLGISDSRIENMSVTKGSIVITFEILPKSTSTEPTIGKVLYILQNGIQTASLPVTDTNGSSLLINTNSFTWSRYKLDNQAEQKVSITPYIVAGAVGGLALVILAVAVAFYWTKTKKSKQVSQSPAPFGQNMQGVDVPRPHSHNVSVIYGNWTVNETDKKYVRESSNISKKGKSSPLGDLPPIE